MKVIPVSFSFKSRNIIDKSDNIYPFLYSAELPKSQKQLQKFGIATGFLALSAICITLFNLRKGKKYPRNIVEIIDMNKGLNTLPNLHRTTDELKRKVLHPLKCAVLNGKEKPKKFKSGVIFVNENETICNNVVNALSEHIKELEITTVDIGKNKKSLKRNELVKETFKQINLAAQRYNEEGSYTVINLGNLDAYTDLKAIKSKKSRVEQLLEDVSNNRYPGVMWIAGSTNPQDLPLFFNNLKSVLVTKIID